MWLEAGQEGTDENSVFQGSGFGAAILRSVFFRMVSAVRGAPLGGWWAGAQQASCGYSVLLTVMELPPPKELFHIRAAGPA